MGTYYQYFVNESDTDVENIYHVIHVKGAIESRKQWGLIGHTHIVGIKDLAYDTLENLCKEGLYNRGVLLSLSGLNDDELCLFLAGITKYIRLYGPGIFIPGGSSNRSAWFFIRIGGIRNGLVWPHRCLDAAVDSYRKGTVDSNPCEQGCHKIDTSIEEVITTTQKSWSRLPAKCCPMGSYDCQIPMPIMGKVRGIDYCISDIVAALNAANIKTIASCCGHGGEAPSKINLEDGRVLHI